MMSRTHAWSLIAMAALAPAIGWSVPGPASADPATARHVVVLGSSTAAGIGPSTPDSGWVNRFRTAIQALNPDHQVTSLAVGGYTTWHVRETGLTPPPGRPAPDTAHNVTRALALGADVIIVNLPSNDVALGYPNVEQFANYDSVRSKAAAAGVPVWFTTSQPRNLSQAGRDSLVAQFDTTLARYGALAIDFWTGIAETNGEIRNEYDSGDGIHLNDPAHRILFDRVMAEGIHLAPVITARTATPALTTATITWTTDEPATSVVDYGTSASLGSQLASTTLVTSHSVQLTGLVEGTLYHYRVSSTDAAGNVASDPIAPGTATFTTCGGAVAPAAIADLSAYATGDAGAGRTHLRLGWSGVTAGHTVKVFRRAWGDYPLYRGTHGGTPAVPATPAAAEAAGWDSSTVTAPNGLDAPPSRGLWHYVAFVTNTCGLVSAPSNLTAGTLDYILGDVGSGLGTCAGAGEAGDAVVNTSDLSALGATYGAAFADTDDRICLDIGPTVDNGLQSRPTPDGVLDFEDLVIYALNFEVPLPAMTTAPLAAARGQAEREELRVEAPASVRAGDTFDVTLRFRGAGSVRAVSARLGWDAAVAEPATVTAGSLLLAHGGLALSPRPGTLDAAVPGTGVAGLAGDGTLAVMTFRARADGAPAVRLAGAIARDGANRAVTLGAAPETGATPATSGLGLVFPNPFRGPLHVTFALARATRAKLVVYDLAGRAVRRLEDGARAAGTHVVTWDGRTDAGESLPAGLYIVSFEAGGLRQSRRVQLIP